MNSIDAGSVTLTDHDIINLRGRIDTFSTLKLLAKKGAPIDVGSLPAWRKGLLIKSFRNHEKSATTYTWSTPDKYKLILVK